jgi:RHS repeat-associated protein
MGYSLSAQTESSSADQADLAIQNNSKLLAICRTGCGFNLSRLNSGPLDQRLYVAQDANHNVTALIDTSGAVKQRYLYDSYGSQTVLSPTWSSTPDAYGLLVGFQGGRLDPATGLYIFRHRDYSPMLGRWNRPDPHPAGPYVQGMNPFQFVGSNPVNRTDPSGLNFPDFPQYPLFPDPGKFVVPLERVMNFRRFRRIGI